jgi:hypothetical protein
MEARDAADVRLANWGGRAIEVNRPYLLAFCPVPIICAA